MSHFKNNTLDQISFENVSIVANGFDPVLQSVDLELPMDQTILIQSSNPTHAVHLLEVLAGRKQPQSGRIFWNEENFHEQEDEILPRHSLVGCYFENQRPSGNESVKNILMSHSNSVQMAESAIEHFEWYDMGQLKFKELTYEQQKLILLVCATLKNPQLLILEDPAVGLTEKSFLEYLDWIQVGQRQGHLRHIFLTNHHPTALRHLDCNTLFLEDGLLYIQDKQKFKKAVHF